MMNVKAINTTQTTAPIRRSPRAWVKLNGKEVIVSVKVNEGKTLIINHKGKQTRIGRNELVRFVKE